MVAGAALLLIPAPVVPPGSRELYSLLILAVAVERVAEMVIARRNARAAFARGGVESGRGHWPFMVVLHVSLLLACMAEVWLLERPFRAWLGGPMLVLVLGAQALRYWVIGTLGERWNARVITVPGDEAVTEGPFRYLRHPNYAAVIVEIAALPLVHGAWLTALIYSAANALLLRVRIRAEEQALAEHTGWAADMADKPRLVPGAGG